MRGFFDILHQLVLFLPLHFRPRSLIAAVYLKQDVTEVNDAQLVVLRKFRNGKLKVLRKKVHHALNSVD